MLVIQSDTFKLHIDMLWSDCIYCKIKITLPDILQISKVDQQV
jgi:hypothetical protein